MTSSVPGLHQLRKAASSFAIVEVEARGRPAQDVEHAVAAERRGATRP